MSTHGAEDPFRLTEPDGDDERARSELDQDIEKHVDPGDAQLQTERKTVQAGVDKSSANLTTVLDNQDVQEDIARPKDRSDVATASSTPDGELEKKKAAAALAEETAAKASEKSAQSIASKFIALTLGLAIIGSIVLEVIKQLRDTDPTTPKNKSPLDDATVEKLTALYKSWKDQPDPAFWTGLADYVDAHEGEMSIGDQLGFLSLVVTLAPDCGGFIWDSATDQSAAADELVAAYTVGGNSAGALYRCAATLSYQGQPVPRVATAQVARLAMAWAGVTALGAVSP